MEFVGQVHWFQSYFKPRDGKRKLLVSGGRDGQAAWQVMAAMERHGFAIGEALLNYPPPPGSEGEVLEIDCSFVKPSDLIGVDTRPAFSDEQEGPRKNIPKGYTSLELFLDEVWALYFDTLSRGTVILQPWLRPLLEAGFESRREMNFMQSERSDYKTLNACDGSGEQKQQNCGRTAAFLLYQPSLCKGGPGLLGKFGLDSTTTLAHAYLLRHRHSDLLVRPGFHMLELTTVPTPLRVPDMRWALEWKSELILSAPPAALPDRLERLGQEVFSAPDK